MFRKSNYISTLVLMFVLHICITESNGQTFTASDLPILVINTNGQTIIDEPKITANLGIIDYPDRAENKISDPFNGYNGKIGIEIRGSSSQSFPKKGYGFETRKADGSNNNVSLLGMPEENDWVLHGPYSDKSLMRNSLCYILAGSVMEYAPGVRYCELVINGVYMGVYVLVEKIKRDKSRVNISNISNQDNTGDNLTGGYIIKIDKESGSNNGGWTSTYKAIPGNPQNTYFQYDFPKASDITTPQKMYIQQFFVKLENIIASSDYVHLQTGYRKYIDDKSLIDYILMNELSKNPDAYRLSTFFYKDKDSKGGKLKFGPVWDYNLGFGNVNYCTNGHPQGLVISGFNEVCSGDYWVIHFWWEKFMKDPKFKSDLKLRWFELRQNQLSNQRIQFVVDSLSSVLSKAQVRNFQRWPVLNEYVWPNYYIGGTYSNEINHLKNWLTERLMWLDVEFGSYTSVKNYPKEHFVQISPNPVSDYLTVSMQENISVYQTQILDMNGNIIQTNTYAQNNPNNTFQIHSTGLSPGIYFLRLHTEQGIKTTRFVKI